MNETGFDPAATLTGRLEDMTAEQAVKMVRELCSQLEHDADSFHGNIWPGNVTLDDGGRAVLGDGSSAPVSERSADQVEFLAPEYFWEEAGSAAADVYSLGLLLYAACAKGFMPFQPRGGALTDKDRSAALRQRMKGGKFPMPSGISEGLRAVLQKALAYGPEERYISSAELLSALDETEEAAAMEGATAVDGAVAKQIGQTDELPSTEEDLPQEGEPQAVPASDSVTGRDPALDDLYLGEEIDVPNFVVSSSPAQDDTYAEEGGSPAGEKRYTVQKDIDHSSRKKSHSRSNQKKKKKVSPLIPILSVVAVIVIVVVVVYLFAGRGILNRVSGDEVIEAEPTNDPYVITALDDAPEATADPTAAEEDEDASAEAGAGNDASDMIVLAAGGATTDDLDVEPVGETVYVTSIANLRSGPGISYDVMQTVPEGTELIRTDTVNNWSEVQYDGNAYYISTSLISETPPTDTEVAEDTDDTDTSTAQTEDDTVVLVGGNGSTSTNTTTTDTNSSTGSNSSTGTSTGSTSSSTGTSTGTTSSSAGTSTGNTSSNVGTTTTGTTSSTSSTLSVTETRDVVQVSKTEVNVRSGPGTTYDVLGQVDEGTYLQRTGTVSNGWSQVVYKGQEAYIDSSLLSVMSETHLTDAIGTLTVTSAVNVRSGPSTDYSILGVADTGTSLTITGIVGTKWYRVSYNGEDGYVNRNLISVQGFALVNEQSGTVTVTSDANVRSGPSTDFSILGVASTGTVLTVTGFADSNWYQVTYNDQTGYIAANLVS